MIEPTKDIPPPPIRTLCVGMLRVRNEGRWIREVVSSILPVCSRVFVFDDHSTDNTVAECLAAGADRISVINSTFSSCNESRDKNLIYDAIISYYPPVNNGFCWPQWILAIDGDEVLHPDDVPLLIECLNTPNVWAWRQRIIYLWNDRAHYRVDGVYKTFNRPSLFRVENPSFRFQSTPWGKDPTTGESINFHCSSIPQELLYLAKESEVRLLHLGYMHKEDRIRKWDWYANKMDVGNAAEDFYRHIVQGDVPEVPASAKLKWAGPLEIVPL